MTTRTIDDIDGKPVEIEIEDAPPDERLTLDEVIQTFQLARAIIKGGVPAPLTLPPYKPYPRKKKGKDGRK